MWRVANDLHKSISYSFLPVGHTKFSPDWCFGLLKQKLRHSKVDSLHDLVEVVDRSATVNVAQLTGTQNGEVVVKTYNWQEGVSPAFKKVPAIKKLHHFHISKDDKGSVVLKVKEHINDSFRTIKNLIKSPIPQDLPDQIVPKGLSLERRWYLHDKIREFCADESKDAVCPLPSEELQTPEPTNSTHSIVPPIPSSNNESDNPGPRPKKKRRVCGSCGLSGHNRRSCQQ